MKCSLWVLYHMGICIEMKNKVKRQNLMIHRIFMWRYIYPFNINNVYNNYRMTTSINNQIKYYSRDVLYCIVFNDL